MAGPRKRAANVNKLLAFGCAFAACKRNFCHNKSVSYLQPVLRIASGFR
jgi:hypothetical protein